MHKINSAEFVKYLKENWKGKPCLMCGGVDWRVQAAIFQLTPYGEANLFIGSPNVPVVPVVCTQCGNTLLVSAKVAGLVDE